MTTEISDLDHTDRIILGFGKILIYSDRFYCYCSKESAHNGNAAFKCQLKIQNQFHLWEDAQYELHPLKASCSRALYRPDAKSMAVSLMLTIHIAQTDRLKPINHQSMRQCGQLYYSGQLI
ncbi:hypothetical protein DERF_004213 [Dermatophagoides farinae]|uniref:Uncharacterized protein n=1 Tax=Dermatophagoides farinae TaxID=6954 RepID=A0A922L5Z7_DERFA|nr:hypothetical protein DERF_004213 [Dermatophagoides farinae]